ncbi:hypothetical protein RHMOL_Rhmol04G0190600 [Rhododendron molle]|uniref:Uncharacterized protein n=1 Tax=Rhododendron molle TaxID=49168 RepID=A0ACC0P2E3_RHOML|nr:hypothetical protein RHMOL_Rhmol04G0190600 [Rhododendron molle]
MMGMMTDQNHSEKHARGYNATNAFTSLGATLDPRVLTGSGPTSFTIHGELQHRTGSLLPQHGKDAKYAQLYILDPTSALEVHNHNNGQLRRDVLETIQETLLFILPSSFTGSPRHMFEIFQNSMAITRYNHHPDIFLTVIANPKWPEITSALLPHQTAVDHPDLVARVFELKRKTLMKELVCAEFPNSEEDPELFETVKSCMVHGPCSARNPHASCMENGKCTKRHPRDFVETTTVDENGYPIYRRRNDGKVYIVRGHEVDNRDVVPYNPHLSKMFNCHINVEVCAGMRCVKYIHKYIYKGYDRTTMVLGSANEIKQYLDGRYIGPPEAAWHIFGHHMHEEVPMVTQLALHLPGMHRVNFNPKESLEDIIARAGIEKSTLTGFFAWYAANPNSTPYTYQEFPQYFVWDRTNNVWTPRKFGFAIERMYFASPNSDEKFYLRLLLTIVKGPKSYKDLCTIDNVVYDTFKSACVARGLLEDDDEWIQCLQEAAIMKTGYQLRRLFCVILTQCSPLQPLELWKRFSINICDDLTHKIHTLFAIPNPTETHIEDYDLYLLNQMLEETVDRTLRDIRDSPKPFGGITVVLGGDFHQILPVVPKGVREEIVNASLRRSDLWDDICVLTLNLNMRLNTTDPENAAFANFLMEVILHNNFDHS